MSFARPIAVAFSMMLISSGYSQLPSGKRHHMDRYDMPPGAVSISRQLGSGHPVSNYYQPVSFVGPDGTQIALATSDDFSPSQDGPVLAGILIGPAYRLKVSGILYHEGVEVFPTVEIIERVCPPPGLQTIFPIPIVFTHEDLELGIAGGMVTRVVYLEDPFTHVE